MDKEGIIKIRLSKAGPFIILRRRALLMEKTFIAYDCPSQLRADDGWVTQEMGGKRVLVIGGSGYLGQHLLCKLADIVTSPFQLAYTFHSPLPSKLSSSIPSALAFHADLKTGLGFDAISAKFGLPDVVVNCAAISIPRACEADPAAAMAVNVPSALIKWLSSFSVPGILLIHLSSDQVYEGVKSFYKEGDGTAPVNMYGKSKVAAEKFIADNWSNFAILRSSIIYGPQSVSPVPKSLPIQWIDEALSRGDQVDFFYDEFRCPVYVNDVVNVILALSERWISGGQHVRLVINVGGPDRVPRSEMAQIVAACRGHDSSRIRSVSASSVDRGVNSPADISMDISRLVQELGITPTPFKDGVELTLR